MRSKILKEVLDNATPEVIARVNQISNDLLIEKLWEENEEMRAMIQNLIDALGSLEAYELPIYDKAGKFLNKTNRK